MLVMLLLFEPGQTAAITAIETEVPHRMNFWFGASSTALNFPLHRRFILLAGRALAKRNRYTLAFIVAYIECLFVPFATVLGVFTLIVLSGESIKALFGSQSPQL
jgi:hypothetical protein